MCQQRDRMVVMANDRILPRSAPGWRSRRRRMKFDRTTMRHVRPDEGAADESVRPVIEIVAGKVVDDCSQCARRHEWIDVHTLVVKHVDAANRLIAVIASSDALTAARVVWLADARQQQKPDIVEREGGHQNKLGRLLELAADSIRVDHTGRLPAGVV